LDSALSGTGKLRRRKTLRAKGSEEPDDSNGNSGRRNKPKNKVQMVQTALGQLPAIILIGMFHLMIGIPFGVSYFPVGWRNDVSLDDMGGNNSTTSGGGGNDEDSIHGPFPLPGKEGKFILTISQFCYACNRRCLSNNGPQFPVGLRCYSAGYQVFSVRVHFGPNRIHLNVQFSKLHQHPNG
jgi:hypothetical protein